MAELFVILTMQRQVITGGTEAITWTGHITPGPGAGRQSIFRTALDQPALLAYRFGAVLFYSAEPAQLAEKEETS